MFSDALKTAGELDAHFAATKELKGTLQSQSVSWISVSSREDLEPGVLYRLHIVVNVKGYDSSMGFTHWAHKPTLTDADVRLSDMRYFHRFNFFRNLFVKYAKPGASP